MPSPFPGMDPYIEMQEWEDFHGRFIADMADVLGAQVQPRYLVRYQRRVYVEHEPEAFLTIRERETLDVITVIELLSPSNKRPGSDGRKEYLTKREAVLQSTAHLVELDLLRGGQRLPSRPPLSPGDHCAIVSRADRRPKAEVYSWTLHEPIPSIPVPLAGDDPDVILDLQTLFEYRYARSGYDASLDYTAAIEPPLNDDDARRVQELLARRRGEL